MAEKFYNLNVRLDRNLLKALKKEAEEQQRSLSGQVRFLLEKRLGEEQNRKSAQ